MKSQTIDQKGSERRVPNPSERAVRNGLSDRIGLDPSLSGKVANRSGANGRPPVMDDQELLALARDLNQAQGRPPRAQELIDAAGGCQRQRAIRTIQRLRNELAAKAVRAQLTLPQDLEAELRGWIGRWIELAARQLAQRHADFELQSESKLTDARDLLAEQKERLSVLRSQLDEQRSLAQHNGQASETLRTENAALRSERDIALAISEERRRLLNALAEGRGDE